MNHHSIRWTAALALAAASFNVLAHGDEPHDDEPPALAGAEPGRSRFEAATDAFEIVGRLDGATLTLYVNRFATNEPVPQALIELETGTMKAVAGHRADEGSYVVDDAAFVDTLRQPGAHAIVVTVTAGDEADLLEGTLNVAAAPRSADDTRAPVGPAMAGALGLAVLGAGAFALRRRQAPNGSTR